MSWPIHGDRLRMLEQGKNQWRSKMFMDIFLVAAWSLWKERNNNYFREIHPSFASWKTRFIQDFTNLSYRVLEDKRSFISAFTASIS
jgi:hypothetical protein